MTVAEGEYTGAPFSLLPVTSMGPQLDSCGRNAYTLHPSVHEPSLQWGRNLTVAEGQRSPGLADESFSLQWGRNLTVAEGAQAGTFDADDTQ